MNESSLSYGAFVHRENTTFKIHAPGAAKAFVVIFAHAEDSTGTEYAMESAGNGDWTLTLDNAGVGTLYGYRLDGNSGGIDPKVIIADPYSLAAVTQNAYRPVAKSLIIDESFDWGDDAWKAIDARDLIIYEMHIRDMTEDPSSGVEQRGTYLGLTEPNRHGGLSHLKSLGVNAVQILPVMDFANFEVPFEDSTAPVFNSWNPYARNHWGYMTTFFFAPESYYASNGTDTPGAWNGIGGKAVPEFKTLIKTLHQNDLAVIMDVVYNHVSNYDYQPMKYSGREDYFRFDKKGNWKSESGCGNDTQSENPVMRKMILESLKFWMTHYHIDGFRFDLGNLIDKETRELIIKELREINPHVIILAEPWGAGYDPNGFSDQGWASFNDKIRNGVKGQNPNDGLGFIFGKWQGDNTPKTLERYAMGSLRKFGGQYVSTAHSVNYLEVHDDYTLGDFIRIGSGAVGEHEVITDREANAQVRGVQLAMNKLAALYLFTSQGITFIHEGQEWARSKVIANTDVPDPQVGQLDHNSYNKDNQTNWLNWNEMDENPELVDYYKGLIALRNLFPEFRHSSPDDFEFINTRTKIALTYKLAGRFMVALNGDPKRPLELLVPEDETWSVLVDGDRVDLSGSKTMSGKIWVPSTSGMVLIKK